MKLVHILDDSNFVFIDGTFENKNINSIRSDKVKEVLLNECNEDIKDIEDNWSNTIDVSIPSYYDDDDDDYDDADDDDDDNDDTANEYGRITMNINIDESPTLDEYFLKSTLTLCRIIAKLADGWETDRFYKDLNDELENLLNNT